MKKINLRRALPLLPVLALASIAPIAFPAAQMGYASFKQLGAYAVIPSAILLFLLAAVDFRKGGRSVSRVVLDGALAGALATLALEAIRYPAFRLGFMPGNMPQLMGVLLLDRFAHGPSLASNVAGFAYHFYNGACFGIVFAALVEAGILRSRRVWGIGYGVLIGLGFLVSPVVKSLGVGLFGRDYGWHFAATVLTAHVAFGWSLALMLRAETVHLRHRLDRIHPASGFQR